jgi:hypothetical protein
MAQVGYFGGDVWMHTIPITARFCRAVFPGRASRCSIPHTGFSSPVSSAPKQSANLPVVHRDITKDPRIVDNQYRYLLYRA